jgi:hypothetical protein
MLFRVTDGRGRGAVAGRERTMHSKRGSGFVVMCIPGFIGHRVRSSTTKAVRTPRRLRSLWRLRVGAVAALGVATTLALLPSAPAFGAGIHQRRPDPPLRPALAASFALGRGGKPVLSTQPADDIPATIGGKTVVIDPRSSIGHTDPSCEIPPEGAVVTPVTSPSDAVEEVFGGLWDCPSGAPSGTGFVAGIDAVKAAPTVSKLSKKSLYAPPFSAEAGSVKATTVRVNGKRVNVFTFRTTAPSPPLPAGTVFETASAEPHAHLLVSATTPSGTKAAPYLTAMLKAGAGKTPRAG